MEGPLGGTVHTLPAIIKGALAQDPKILPSRNDLTPLARNERICRVTIAKKQETKVSRTQRLCEDIAAGKRRPCCRPGCPHHNPKTAKYLP